MVVDLCRLCLSPADEDMHILDNVLSNKIKECVSVEVTLFETHPKWVCTICVGKIENWHEFKTMCLNSIRILESQVDIKLNELPLAKDPDVGQRIGDEQQFVKCSVIQKMKNLKSNYCQDHHIGQDVIKGDLDPNNLCITNNETDSIFSDADCSVKQDETNCTEVKPIEDSGIYTCDFCSEIFEYYIDYLDHQNVHNGEAIFSCERCKLTFFSRQDLASHEKKHKVRCHICGIDVQKQSLKLHLNKHTDRFKCSHCSLTFTCGPLLNEHIVARHTKLKQYFCDTCGKDFATRSSLILHLKIHSDEKHYKCDKCDYAGRTSISLRIHMSKHETGTYICEYCSKMFKSNRNLRDHLRRVHKSDKKHPCEFCSMKFSLRYLLEQHKRTHTGIHPYNCPKCYKTFARSDGLKEHMNTHDSKISYKCNTCTKVFRTKRGLQRHNCIQILEVKKKDIDA